MNGPAVSRRLRRRTWIVAVAALAALVIADHRGWLLARGPDDMAAYHGVRARVSRVIDGGTIEIDLPDRLRGRPVTVVRLWGVDCPRPAARERRADRLAGAASDFARTLAAGRSVVLDLETQRTRDPMGRVLAHVRLPGATSLNERMLAEGLARVNERWPHAHLTRYAAVERSARRRGVGVWEGRPSEPSAVSRRSAVIPDN